MKRQKLLLRAILLAALISLAVCAAKKTEPKLDDRSRIIYALFTEVNPNLDPSDAKKYAEIIIEASEKFKQNPYVIAAIIVHESTVNSKALSKGGDYGLMQVRWKIHEKAIKQRFPKVKRGKDIFDARVNVFFGTEIFRDCMRKSNNDVGKALLRYSAGNTKMRDKVLSTLSDLEARDRNSMIKTRNRKGKF